MNWLLYQSALYGTISITIPVDCEEQLVIRFLNVKNIHPAEIQCQLVEVYGEGIMNERNVHTWYPLFNEGSTDVHNEAQSGRPSVITEGLKGTVDGHVRENRCYIESLKFGFNLNTFQLGEYLLKVYIQ